MRFLVVYPTSPRRWIARILGTDENAKGTSKQFAVGKLLEQVGFTYGLNVMPYDEIWAWALRHPSTRCATPI